MGIFALNSNQQLNPIYFFALFFFLKNEGKILTED